MGNINVAVQANCDMQTVQAPRASAILYSVICQRADSRPWLLPANICPIVPITFLKARVPFEFTDILDKTLHLDQDQVAGRITTRKYGGLLYAHTYGESSTPNDFFFSLHSLDPKLLIVDDRCLCAPDLDPAPDSCADVTLYSTGYAKIAELNFGGYAFIKDNFEYQPAHLPFDPSHYADLEKNYKDAVSRRVPFEYRDSDWLETDAPARAWYDYRRQIEDALADSLTQRAALNNIYSARLPSEIQLPREYQAWRFNIRVKNRARILDAIFKAGLFASAHYASLAGIMGDGNAPHAEALASEVINLFNDYHFDEQKAEQICSVILENL